MLIIGKEEALDAAIKVLQGHFQVKDPTSLEDCLGVQIVQSDDNKKAWLGQPTIIKSLEKQFGERVAKKKMTITPATPDLVVERWMIFLRWMKKHNPYTGQEWEHCCISPSRADLISHERVIQEYGWCLHGTCCRDVQGHKFCLDIKTLGLRMVPTFKDGIWKLEALSDSDFANDKDTRYSVYGYIIYFCGVPVAWKVKA